MMSGEAFGCWVYGVLLALAILVNVFFWQAISDAAMDDRDHKVIESE